MNLFKSVGTLTVGTAAAQGIMFLGVFFLSRLYSPEEFGLYAVVLGSVSIISAVSSLRYEMTILLPKQEKASRLALQLAFMMAGIINLIGLVVVLILVISGLVDMYWITVPVAAFLVSVINVGAFLQNRNQAYGRIVGVQIVRAFMFVFTGILLAWLGVAENGLVGAMLISYFVPAIFVLLVDFREFHAFNRNFGWRHLLVWGKKHNKFFYYSTPAVLISSLASQAPVLLLTVFMGAAFAGYYSMVHRIVMAPVVLISASVNKVYMQSVTSKLAAGKRIYPFTKSLIKRFIVPGIILSLVMALLFYFDALQKLLGEKWVEIDTYALVMVPAFLLGFIARSISGFDVLGRNELGLVYQLALLAAMSLATILSSMLVSGGFFVFMFISLALSVYYFGQAISILSISKKIDKFNVR